MGDNPWISAIVRLVRILGACRYSQLPHWSHVRVASHTDRYVRLHSLFLGESSGIYRTGPNVFATVLPTSSSVWALTWA